MKRYIHFLFVCSANMNRSATGEHVARSRGFAADSVGSRPDLLVGRPLTLESIQRVQRIACMEDCHRQAVIALAIERDPDIDVLGIPDVYGYNNPELVRLLLAYVGTFRIAPLPVVPGFSATDLTLTQNRV